MTAQWDDDTLLPLQDQTRDSRGLQQCVVSQQEARVSQAAQADQGNIIRPCTDQLIRGQGLSKTMKQWVEPEQEEER
eukprot:5312955-Amphidinium_carterae.1